MPARGSPSASSWASGCAATPVEQLLDVAALVRRASSPGRCRSTRRSPAGSQVRTLYPASCRSAMSRAPRTGRRRRWCRRAAPSPGPSARWAPGSSAVASATGNQWMRISVPSNEVSVRSLSTSGTGVASIGSRLGPRSHSWPPPVPSPVGAAVVVVSGASVASAPSEPSEEQAEPARRPAGLVR